MVTQSNPSSLRALRPEREAGADLVWDLVGNDVQALSVERETKRGLDTGTKGLRVACLR